ncbi:MAG: hypothetical protein AAGA56_23660 [Myxococcota bacterium]
MNTPTWWVGAGLAGALALSGVACGDDDESEPTGLSDETDTDTSMSTGTSSPSGTASTTSTGPNDTGAYPAGPYGTAVGDTNAFLEFEGFLSPSANDPGEYVRFDMNDVRTSGSPLVLLHLAATF